MAASTGNCFICGKTAGKTAIKNHVLKDHNSGGESCWLMKAEDAYNRDCWILFTVPLDAALSAVDKFLRQIWCECCGHLSAFRMGGRDLGKARKLSSLDLGDAFMYEYDFGTTTEIVLTIIDEISRAKQREKIQLLARNVPEQELCERCGAPAAVVDSLDGAFLCDKCAEGAEDDSIEPKRMGVVVARLNDNLAHAARLRRLFDLLDKCGCDTDVLRDTFQHHYFAHTVMKFVQQVAEDFTVANRREPRHRPRIPQFAVDGQKRRTPRFV